MDKISIAVKDAPCPGQSRKKSTKIHIAQKIAWNYLLAVGYVKNLDDLELISIEEYRRNRVEKKTIETKFKKMLNSKR